MKAKTPLALTSINNIIKNPLMIKYRPFPCPPPSSPTSIRSSRLRIRIRSLPPSLVMEETSPVSDTDIETDSQSVSRRLILPSDALRTKETLRIMQQQVPDFLDSEVHFISSFYSIAAMDGQTADHLQQAICNYSRDGILTVMCMGHNRGWEEAASMFSGASIEIKTCNAALLEAPGKRHLLQQDLAGGNFRAW